MIDHYYVTHAQLLALRNVVAFIVQTMPEEQKEVSVVSAPSGRS
ncbi:hypothetical protein JQ760_006180 [Klebsiella pneumoniae]